MLKRGTVQSSEGTFRAFLESAPDAMVVVDKKGRMALVNSQTVDLFGYARDDLVGKPVEMLIPERFRGDHAGHRGHYFSDPRVRPMGAGLDLFGLRKDGSEFPVEISLSPIEIDEGSHVLCAIRDVTSRKESEEEIRRAQQFLDSVIRNIPLMVFVKNAKDLRFVRLNRAGEDLLGIREEEMLGKNDYDFFPKSEADFFTGKDREVLVGKKLADIPEEPIETKNGLRYLHTRKIPILDTSGEPLYLLGISEDITERRLAEQRFRALLESAPDAMVIVDPDGEIVLINAQTERLFGYGHDELLGRPVEILVPERFRKQHVGHRSMYAGDPRARPMGAGLDLFGLRKDGCEFPIEISLSPIEMEDGVLIISAIRDITERKRAEEEVARSRRELREYIDSMSTFSAKVGLDGRLHLVNRAAFLASGMPSMEALLAVNFLEGEWFAFDPVVQARVKGAFQRALAGTPVNYDERIFAFGRVLTINFSLIPIDGAEGNVSYILAEGRDISALKEAEEALREREARLAEAQQIAGLGSWEWDLVSGRVTWSEHLHRIYGVTPAEFTPTYDGFLTLVHPEDRARVNELVKRTLDAKRPLLIEHRIIRPDKTVRMVQARGGVIVDSTGQAVKMVGTVQDITERIDADRLEMEKIRLLAEVAERKRSEETLERQARDLARSNADLEQFAYVASHDLQEPLRMVASYTQLLARRYKGQIDREADEFVNYTIEGVARMQTLIQDLLAYSRVGTDTTPAKPIPCERAFDQAVANLKSSIEGTGAIVTRGPLPVVMADFTLLVQVFQNLIGNALKFRKAVEVPRVEVTAESRDHEWLFSVRDNGIGIDPQFANRIFVIFKRLHGREAYPGTGIGLAICKKIVERYSGRIWVESVPGNGSVFHFTLPRLAGPGKDASA